MKVIYRIVISFFFVIWLGGMYLVFTVSNNPGRAEAITLFLASILASPYFIPGIFAFFVFIILVLVGPVWARMIAQSSLRSKLEKSGVRTLAKITAIKDTGITINENPRVNLTVNILEHEASFDLTVSRVNIPKVGDTVPVLYDPQNPTRAVYANT